MVFFSKIPLEKVDFICSLTGAAMVQPVMESALRTTQLATGLVEKYQD